MAQKKILGEAVAFPLYIYMQCWVKKKWIDLGYTFESNLEYSPLLSYKTRVLPTERRLAVRAAHLF